MNDALTWPQSYPAVFHVRVLAAQCQIQWLAADLPGMVRAARQMLLFCDQLHLAEMRSWAAYYLGCVYYEWNELDRAEEVLEPIVHQAAGASGIAFANASCALAATYQAQGRTADARALLAAAVDSLRTTQRNYLPLLNAFAAELALRQGDVSGAAQWIVQQNTPIPRRTGCSIFLRPS